jgi:hypothetical protein
MNNKYSTPSKEYRFKITKKDVNGKKKLLPFVLYETMESTAMESLSPIKDTLNFNNNLFKLYLLKNAELNDELIITHKVERFNNKEILLKILVYKSTNDQLDVICNATFGYNINNHNLDLAS